MAGVECISDSAPASLNSLVIPAVGCSNAHNKTNEIRNPRYEIRNTTYDNISIIGDGGMGTVLAILLCEKADALIAQAECAHEPRQTGLEVKIWGYDADQLAETAKARENKKFLPGYKIPQSLIFEPDDAKIMAEADLIVSAAPCQFMRSVWTRLAAHVPASVPIVSVAKGIENDTLLRPTRILAEVLGRIRAPADEPPRTIKLENAGGAGEDLHFLPAMRLAVLSGPTIADELARKLPATACVASDDQALAENVQHTFSDGVPWLRVYTNSDILGVELAGAMKNVIALAAGLIDGTGLGDNAKAALLTRGLAEITRLGVAMGAAPLTFAGLAGLGDLVTTCISPTGRNRSFGERVGKGMSVNEARDATESVVEGIATCESVVQLAARHKIEMPITQAIYEIIFKNKPVKQAVADLMRRELKAE